MKSQLLEKLIQEFVLDSDTEPKTRDCYSRTLKQFNIFITNSEIDISEIKKANIISYKKYLINKGLSDMTIYTYLASVRLFFTWLESNKAYPNIAKTVTNKVDRRTFRKSPLTVNQCLNLFKSITNNGSKRDIAIASILLGCGIKLTELINANIGDIQVISEKNILVIRSRSNYVANNFAKIPDLTHNYLQAYLRERGLVRKSEPLFVSTSNNSFNQRLSERTISKIIKEGLRSTGLDNKIYTTASLRHTAATYMIANGASIFEVKTTLRHSSINTTEKYIATILEDVRLFDNTEDLLNNIQKIK